MKLANLCKILGSVVIAFMAPAIKADTILATNALWTVTGGNSNLTTGASYQAAFGYASDGLYSYNTFWAPGSGLNPSILDLRTTINLTGYDLATVQYSFAIDNDIKVYVNGMQITSLVHEGAASWTSFAALGNITSGLNQIDVEAVDRGGAAYFAMQVRGTHLVPETGSTLLMLGAGLVGFVSFRRRFARA